MALIDDKDEGRRRKSENRPENEAAGKPQPKKRRPGTPEVGNSLRSAYQQTVNEDIPREMLELLGKLG